MGEIVRRSIDKKRICLLQSATKKDAILELIDLVKISEKDIDINQLESNIFHREEIMSTGIGLGVGIPHTRIEGVTNPFIVIGISRSGIRDYESIDGMAVNLIFLIIAGLNQHKEYIQLLSRIVKKIKDDPFRKSLVTMYDIDEIAKAFDENNH